VVEVFRDVDDVRSEVFSDNVIREAAAEVEAVALADGIENRAVVIAEDFAGFLLADFAGFTVEVLLEEVFHTDLANEADAHGFFLGGNIELAFGGELLDFGFRHGADWKEGFRGSGVAHAIEEVGLIFIGVDGFQEVDFSGGGSFRRVGFGLVGVFDRADLGVVAGRDEVGTAFDSPIVEEFELNQLVTHDVGVWGAAFFEFGEHVVDDFGFIILLEVPDLKVEVELDGDALGISEILRPGALHAGEVFGPVLHVDAGDVVTLLLQKQRRD